MRWWPVHWSHAQWSRKAHQEKQALWKSRSWTQRLHHKCWPCRLRWCSKMCLLSRLCDWQAGENWKLCVRGQSAGRGPTKGLGECNHRWEYPATSWGWTNLLASPATFPLCRWPWIPSHPCRPCIGICGRNKKLPVFIHNNNIKKCNWHKTASSAASKLEPVLSHQIPVWPGTCSHMGNQHRGTRVDLQSGKWLYLPS